MSNLNDRIELEQQFILRVPTKLADQLGVSSELELEFVQGQKEFSLKIQDDSESKMLKGSIHKLPCIVESHKSFDTCNFYKSGDIGQILVVHDDTVQSAPVPTEFQEILASGLTIPTNNIVNRRWRKPVEDHFYTNQEKEILKSIRGGADQLEIEIVKASDYVGVEDSCEKITQPIPKAWRYVKREAAVRYLETQPIETLDVLQAKFRAQVEAMGTVRHQTVIRKSSDKQSFTIKIPSKQSPKVQPVPVSKSNQPTLKIPSQPSEPLLPAVISKHAMTFAPSKKSGQMTFVNSPRKTPSLLPGTTPSQSKASSRQHSILDIILSKPVTVDSIPHLPVTSVPSKEIEEITATLRIKKQKVYNVINYAEKLKLSKEIKELEVRLKSLTT